ncbi:RICIN domain-containing protein [Streptomyces yaizuensis]|uniref:Ricin-type beta-trefoil lectin domain protein n=1 Tax=Streptomyces yaizuensis TaxID=2989713 RepID=A0ABQ5NXI4_9ACTN|nr:RICIN domain-containing protein [Streptomyces sp. YSPA8]GLF95084.1 ricin-type beta-trefoil lectin domain protein [Streptomyces sp. YSPA8]
MPRVLAAVLVICCTALGIVASPFQTPAAHAETPRARAAGSCGSPLQCVDFTSLGNGRVLDVQNGSLGDGAFIVTNTAPGHHQSWRLNVDASDSSFTIVNNTTGKCIDLGWPVLRQQTCRGQKSQQWYFQPVRGAANAFMVRNENNNACLDLVANAQYDDAWTGQSTCHGRVNQQWSTVPEARRLAVEYAAKQCQKDTSTCSWAARSETPPAPLPTVCASSVWFNNTSGPITQTFAVTKTTGWQNSLSTKMSTGFTTGDLPNLALKVTTTLENQFSHVWSGSESVNNQVTVPVPAAQYGWVTLSVLATKVTGTWTFDARGLPWTAEDTVTVPLKDAPAGGATHYIANTDPVFTSCA